MLKLLLVSFLVNAFTEYSSAISSRISIVNNGYEDILIALPKRFPLNNRFQLISSLRNLLHQSSSLLLHVTKGRAKFLSAIFLIPEEWGDTDTWLRDRDKSITLDEAGAWFNREKADIVVTNSNEKEHPYTLHHQGCGKQSLRIYLPANFSLHGNLQQKGAEFVRLWSEFRYGVFPEGGFQDDEKYPLTYRVPGEDNDRSTDCVNRPFRIPDECEVEWDCDKTHIIPSIMDQHYTNGTSFCEGHSGLGQIHVPEAPSKQNLLCTEEGTYFTVLRSSDFKNGRNAAPKIQVQRDLSFRYIKENSADRIFVAIDTSSKMNSEDRYATIKNALSRFILYDLPPGSKLSLLTFEARDVSFVTSDLYINGSDSRKEYLERQPLPDTPSEIAYSCPSCVLLDIIQPLENATDATPHIILVTANNTMENSTYNYIVEAIKLLDISLHVLMLSDADSERFDENSSLYSLCKETNNHFVYLGGDFLGNSYSAFANTVHSSSKNILIIQSYLSTLDEESLFFPITIEENVTQKLTVSLSGPLFLTPPLKFAKTVLKTPDGSLIYAEKQQLIPAWTFEVTNLHTGTYTLETWRNRRSTSPVLLTVIGQPSENGAISARVWIETVDDELIQPSPIQIFAEVRMGTYPIVNATVLAYVQHPNNDGSSEMITLDNGLGNVDITKNDGIYSHFFTNFTSTGYYNVYLNVTGGVDNPSAVLKGPSSHCCGSNFPPNDLIQLRPFRRQAGPVTFKVNSIPERDQYPPAKITDLSVKISADLIFYLQWSAVGNNYDSGVASKYEIKVFYDRSLIQKRFSDSGLEIYNETIETTEEAIYGTTLFHALKLTHLESGLYFVGIRASDDAGNHGEPSNAAAIYVNSETSNRNLDCANYVEIPLPLKGNSALKTSPLFILYLFTISIIKYNFSF